MAFVKTIRDSLEVLGAVGGPKPLYLNAQIRCYGILVISLHLSERVNTPAGVTDKVAQNLCFLCLPPAVGRHDCIVLRCCVPRAKSPSSCGCADTQTRVLT